MSDDLISRQAAIDAKQEFRNPNIVRDSLARTTFERTYANGWNDCNSAWIDAINTLPSAEPGIIRCKDCKHNPKDEWFGCPMSHLSEAQRPETAWCWKAERRADESD